MSDIDFTALRATRATQPEAIAQALASRTRRAIDGGDSRLMIIAADHPGRAAMGVGSEAMAMANRESRPRGSATRRRDERGRVCLDLLVDLGPATFDDKQTWKTWKLTGTNLRL